MSERIMRLRGAPSLGVMSIVAVYAPNGVSKLSAKDSRRPFMPNSTRCWTQRRGGTQRLSLVTSIRSPARRGTGRVSVLTDLEHSPTGNALLNDA